MRKKLEKLEVNLYSQINFLRIELFLFLLIRQILNTSKKGYNMKNLNIILLLSFILSNSLYSDSPFIGHTGESKSYKDAKNSCLGVANRSLNYCALIKNKDKKSECFGVVKRNSGYCMMIKDKDLQNNCLSVSLNNIGYCDMIKNKDLKNSCMAYAKKDSGYCGLIKDANLKNSCYARVEKKSTFCNSLKEDKKKKKEIKEKKSPISIHSAKK